MNRKLEKYNKLLLTLLGILCFFSIPSNAQAKESGISVQAMLPENQIIKDAGYYDLKVTPGQEQTLNFKVFNRSKQVETVNVSINPAYTSENGSFLYTQDASQKDESMEFSLSDIAQTDKVVSIPAESEVILPIKLSIPKDPFKGLILGAIRVTNADIDTEEKKNNQQEGFSINNKLAYSVAIQLREEENMPKSNLILKKVTASQIAGKNVVKAQLQNPTPTIIDDVCYESSVTKKNNDAVLHKQEVENYRVAPNTSYSFPISWDNQPFKAGEYSLHLKVKSIKNQEEWVFDQDFTISSEEAKQLNTSAVDLEKDYSIYIIYGSIVICVLLIILICLIKYFKKKKQTKKMEFKKKNHERKNDVKRNKKKSKPKSKPSC